MIILYIMLLIESMIMIIYDQPIFSKSMTSAAWNPLHQAVLNGLKLPKLRKLIFEESYDLEDPVNQCLEAPRIRGERWGR